MKNHIFIWGMVPFVCFPGMASEKYNVIFIYADDLGKGMISAYGQQQFATPNIDRLVAEGTSFEHAYGCMLSAPARASLLTGYHDCHGYDKWNISQGGQFVVSMKDTALIAEREVELDLKDVKLPQGDLYLPQVFKQAGYVTAQIGKLEWGFTATRKQLRNHGWDYYYGYLDHVRCHGFYPPFLFDNGEIVSIPGNTLANCGKSTEQGDERLMLERYDRRNKAVYSQDIFLQKIHEFIQTHRDEPFFLFHPTQLPHGPVSVPSVHPEVMSNPWLTPLEKEYASMVKKLDDTVGFILEEVHNAGIEKKTILVFAADNGHEIYYPQKERCEKPYRNLENGQLFNDWDNKYYSNKSGDVFNGNAGMAGLKRSNLEGGVHVPLIFYAPGIIPSGLVASDLVANYDFLPTMADWLGVSLPIKKDGISYKQVFERKAALKDCEERFVVFGSNTGPAIVSSEGWKLRYHKKFNEYELFYLPDDPREEHNLCERYPEIVNRLKTKLLLECQGNLQRGVNMVG